MVYRLPCLKCGGWSPDIISILPNKRVKIRCINCDALIDLRCFTSNSKTSKKFEKEELLFAEHGETDKRYLTSPEPVEPLARRRSYRDRVFSLPIRRTLHYNKE